MINSSGCRRARQAALFMLVAVAAPVFAQALPSALRLTFTQHTGVVSATASIPVMVTLTNTSGTQAFAFNSTPPAFGLNPAVLPPTGTYFDPVSGTNVTASFASYSFAGFSSSFGCANTFTTSCTTGPPYNFNFGANPPSPLSLAPGASTTYLFGTFDPSAGAVAPGSYSFFQAGTGIFFQGLDSAGNTLQQRIDLAQTCPGQDAASCGAAGFFTRTVPVPEPSQWAMMALGLVGLAAIKRLAARNA